MKVKDLPGDGSMGNVKVRTPTGQEGWWVSQYSGGVWLTSISPREPGPKTVVPVFVTNLKETLEWDVIERLTQ